MKVKESTISSQIVKSYSYRLGELHFFNHIVINEFNDGVHVTFEDSKELLKKLKGYFGNKPFGFVSNIINSYSIAPLDIKKFKDNIENLTAYAIVSYNKAGLLNAKVENSFCDKENICFEKLDTAANHVYDKVKQTIMI